MGFVPNILALSSLPAAIGILVLAALVIRVNPHRRQNRDLALVLVTEAAIIAGDRGAWLSDDAGESAAIKMVFFAALAAAPFFYLRFLGSAVPSPLLLAWRSRLGAGALLAVGLAAGATVFIFPQAFFGEVFPSPFWNWNWYSAWAARASFTVAGVVLLFAFVTAVDALRRAQRGDAVWKKARIFVLAFGMRDAIFASFFLLSPFTIPAIGGRYWPSIMAPIAVEVAYVALIVYGILRHQVVDIDFRVLRATRRGITASPFAASFFVVVYISEGYLSEHLGIIVGGAIAGLLYYFLFRPLEERLKRRGLVPDPTRPETAPIEQRLAHYRLLEQEALEQGPLTAYEVALLQRFRRQLRLPGNLPHGA